MRGLIPDNVLEDILNRVDIVEMISGYIPLKRAGRNFKALCPFHHEKTASFMVSADRQIYRCFGCGAGGNAFNFLMQYERLEFLEAVQTLARKVGVVLPQEQRQDSKTASLVTQLYKINELAAMFYENIMNSSSGAAVKNYLIKRGIKEETQKLFKLGFAPDRWDALINHLRAKNIGLASIEKAGLILAKENGGYYDRFRNRIIFPISDIKSRPLGFGARVLDNSLPKYINSPETPIYVKGRNLYGLNFSKDAIRDSDQVVIVEGYLDLIVPYQEGVHNIVASLGTALTYEQVRLLKRYTRNVVMVFDPDEAGRLAALRTLDIFIEEDIFVKVVSLSEGFDPDLFVRKNGIDSLRSKIENAENLFDYQLKILKSRNNIKKEEGKRRIADEMLLTIRKVKNEISRAEYIKRLAEELEVEECYVRDEFNKLKEPRVHSGPAAPIEKSKSNVNATEKLLIKLMLEENALINEIRNTLEPADFQDERTSRIVSILFDLVEQGKNVEPSKLISSLGDDSITQLICESALLPDSPLDNKEEVLNDCIQRLKKEKVKARKQHLHEEIRVAQDSGDESRLNRLMQEFHRLVKES
ncbi:MAG: DNA primase [Candidatus Omnitrophota bacterium]